MNPKYRMKSSEKSRWQFLVRSLGWDGSRWMWMLLGAVLAGWVALSVPCRAEIPSGDATTSSLDLKGARILICAGYYAGMDGMPALKRLTDAGAEVRFGNRQELTWEELQKYHVLIIIFDQVTETTPVLKDSTEAIEKFVRAGGGVFFFGTAFELNATINQTLAPFGATFLNEYIQDPQHTFVSPDGFYNLSYAYTDNIAADHPITEGVQGLWYNVDTRSSLLFDTRVIETSGDWKTLVSGDASATSFGIAGHSFQGEKFEKEHEAPGKYQSAPPIFAARELGEGAVALTGLNPVEIFYGQGLLHYGDVATRKGDGLRGSDFERLYDNTLSWLARHGRKSPLLGQGALKSVENSYVKDGETTFDWDDPRLLEGQLCAKPSKGVIGLHSTLSDGKDTPEALIAKAKASGLQWVAFTEKLEELAKGEWEKADVRQHGVLASSAERKETLAPPKWEQLRKICREASTEDFVALPGLDYAVEGGDRWVVFGDFDWPDAKIFSPDRQTIVNPQWWFMIGIPPNGPYNAGHNRLHPWDSTLYNMWPVRTTIAGKQTDDALADFKHQQGVGQDPFPMAVDMIYNVGELGRAADRMCNYVTMDRPGDLTKFFREHSYLSSFLGFVSDGPVITDWRGVNVSRTTGGKWSLPTTERYRLKLSAESAAPITDIQIFDGPELLRRFRPNELQTTVTMDVPHDKQRAIFAVVTDADGKQAITGGHFVRDFLNFRFMCSDRGNSICDLVTRDASGPYLTGPSAPYQRTMQIFGINPGYAMRAFEISPPQVDGGMRPISLDIQPTIFHQFATHPEDPKVWPRLETRMEVPVSSRDGILQEHTATGLVDNAKGDGWTARQVPWDLKGIDVNIRYLNITPQTKDMGVILLEGQIGFTEDATIQEPVEIVSAQVTATPGHGDHYAIVTPEVNVVGLNQSKPFHAEAPMIPGSYAMIFPAQLGATGVMALDEGYVARINAQYPTVRLAVRIADSQGRQVRAGDKITYRALLIRGRPSAQANTAEWEDFAKSMGLRGKPAYQVTDLRAGTVLGTNFLLELAPQDGGFAGTISQAKLPVRLPIRIANMNPNWTFAWFDLDRKEWFPSAVDPVISKGFFTIDTERGSHRIFAGHPVIADNRDLRILALSDGHSKITASVNNVGDAAMDVMVRLNPALGPSEPVKVHLDSGEVKQLEFPFQP